MSHRNAHANPPRRLPSLRVIALGLGIGLATTAVFAVTTPVSAQNASAESGAPSWMERMHGHSHAQMHDHFEQVLAQAGTSPAQRQQIDGLMKTAMAAEHADMHAYHERSRQLKTLLTARDVDQAALAAVRLDQDRLALAISRRLTDTAIAIAQVLTPDQRQQIGARIDRMMRDGMGHHAR